MKRLTLRHIGIVIGALIVSIGYAQQIPLNPLVRHGKLSNGLTYYIHKNTYQKGLAHFYIAQKVGSVLEKKDQRGLAHFLEHMAFNGTTHFPGGDRGVSFLSWCESVGIKFGANLNAYTSIDETVYNINDAPVTREGVVDTCLLILHDWSNDLLLLPEEIDKERGVIHEEWRRARGASMRIYERAGKDFLKGTKYADALPIGDVKVILNFKPQTLRNYYEKWYRPDLQALIIVGDIDPDVIEAKITKLFADVPAQPNAAKREYYPVPDNKKPVVGIYTDKELTGTSISFMFKRDVVPVAERSTEQYRRVAITESLIGDMLNTRLRDISTKPDAPFLGARIYFGNSFLLSSTKGAFSIDVSCKEGRVEEGLAAAYREVLRAVRHGFTDGEVKRAKSSMQSGYDSGYAGRDKISNSSFTNSYVSHFTEGYSAAGQEISYPISTRLLAAITLDEIDACLRNGVTKHNRNIMLTAPESDSIVLPNKKQILATVATTEQETLEEYKDDVDDEPLVVLPDAPEGTIVSQTRDSLFGCDVLTLANGMTLYIKESDLRANEVIFLMQRDGGTSLIPDSLYARLSSFANIVDMGGVGKWTDVQLNKKLADKIVNAYPYTNSLYNGIYGNAMPKDFETMMQLAYLTIVDPHKDEEAFEAWRIRAKQSIRDRANLPQTEYSDSLMRVIYQPTVRNKRTTEADIDNINYDECLALFKEMYDDASDYKAIIIGNIKTDSIAPLIAKYLGALPTKRTPDSWQETSQVEAAGERKLHFTRAQPTPKADIYVNYHTRDLPFTYRNNLLMSILQQTLQIAYTQSIREEAGGTYSVSVRNTQSQFPKQLYLMEISFNTGPDKVAAMLPLVYDEVKRYCADGPIAGSLDKAKEFMLKQQENNLRNNSYWLSKIDDHIFSQLDTHTDFATILNSLTAEDMRDFARAIFQSGNHKEVIMSTP